MSIVCCAEHELCIRRGRVIVVADAHSVRLASFDSWIVVGIDARDGFVTTKGWVEDTKVTALDLARILQDLGIRWIIHTDVATDGAMKGPNFDAQRKMLQAVPSCRVIASGGVTREQDVADLTALSLEEPNLEGVIIGKALYEGTVQLTNLIP